MTTRVYQFGCRPPSENARIVRDQLFSAHCYRNDLVAIERGRRWALRAVDDAPAVRDAVAAVVAAPKAEKRAATTRLREARKAARAAASDELARIAEAEKQILLNAREHTECFWGTYLDVEAAARQARSAPLYGDDAITPNDPHFVPWRGEGHIGIQLQGGLPTHEAIDGNDTRVRVVLAPNRSGRHGYPRYATLWLRAGSEDRAPVWAQWPIKLHRAIPDAARWKWVRVSLRLEGQREQWTCEITVDDQAPSPRSQDEELSGAIAVEWDWTAFEDGRVRVATWSDTRGEGGEVLLPASIVNGLAKPNGIRSVRDDHLNALRPRLAEAIRRSTDAMPDWLRVAGQAVEAKKSPGWFHDLARRWRRERCDAARSAYEILQAWELRDAHLWEYEAGARREACRERRDFYRVLARRWSEQYRTVLLSDQDLSREARWGAESDVRQAASVHEFRDAVRNAFGDDAISTKWRGGAPEDEPPWCERVRDRWEAVGARDEEMFAKRKEKTANAWAARRAKKGAKVTSQESARKPVDNHAE